MEYLDFIEVEKSRTVSEINIVEKGNKLFSKNSNTNIDMRINKIFHNENVAEIILIFKLQHFPSDLPDLYEIYLTHNIKVIDNNLVLKHNLDSELAISYFATHYKESGERLFVELRNKSIKIYNRELIGVYNISESEAFSRCKAILYSYIGKA